MKVVASTDGKILRKVVAHERANLRTKALIVRILTKVHVLIDTIYKCSRNVLFRDAAFVPPFKWGPM
jgi:hypothetical protein